MKSYNEKNVKKKVWGYEGRRKVEVISFDYPIYMNGNRELGLTKVHFPFFGSAFKKFILIIFFTWIIY